MIINNIISNFLYKLKIMNIDKNKLKVESNEVLYDITNIEPSRFKHDCDVCKYLGRYEKYDLYFCKTEPTVIGRFSNKGADYISGMLFATADRSKPLYEAKMRAIKYGLLVG